MNQETKESLESELNALRTKTGNHRWNYDGGGRWWQDPEYLEWWRRIEEIKELLGLPPIKHF